MGNLSQPEMKILAVVIRVFCAAMAFPAQAEVPEESQLIAVVESAATPAEKEDACRRLKLIGTAQAVPALATLLADEHLYQAACDVLEVMPYAEAGEALRASLKTTSGKPKAGAIYALGECRYRAAMPDLASLLSDPDPMLAIAAANALGRMGDGEAVVALRKAMPPAFDPVRSPLRNAMVDALLQCAVQLIDEGDRVRAAALFDQFSQRKEKEQVRTAAAAGLFRVAGDRTLALLAAGMAGNDVSRQLAALQLARDVQDPTATGTFTNLLTKASPAMQIALLGMLQQRGDAAAAPAVLALGHSPDLAVRLAAIAALETLGDPTAIPFLADAATLPDATEQKAARQALIELHRGPIGDAMVAQLVIADPNVQVELIRALTARKDNSAAPQLLELARTNTGSARRAALRGLEQFAAEADLPAVVQLMMQAVDAAARTEVRSVLEALAERTTDGKNLDVTPIVSGLVDGRTETRIALLEVSACFVNAGVRAGLRSGLKDPEAQIRDAAARAICHSRDVELMPDQLKLARHAGESNLRALALEGYIRLAGDGERLNVTPQQRVVLLKPALVLAARVEDKRLLLAVLAGIAHPDALELVEQISKDATVKAEAEIAWLQIASALVTSQPSLAEASLRRLAAIAHDDNVRTQAQALVERFDSRWLCAGPYRQPGKAGRDLFDIAFAPEQAGLGPVAWRPTAGSTDLAIAGMVDLAGEVAGDNCVIYLKTRVFAPAAESVILEIGSDDGIKLWLNHEVTHANNTDRGVTPGEDRVRARLRPGWNDLLAKITQNGGGCGLSLRITTAAGAEIPGLRFEARGEANVKVEGKAAPLR